MDEFEISITVEWPDQLGELHANYYSVSAVPRIGETVKIRSDRFRVTNVVHNLADKRIILCVERIKQ